MKLDPFIKLATLPPADRLPVVVEGLETIGRNVLELVDELKSNAATRNTRSASLVRNVSREEAGKFLVLIDAYRCPAADQNTLTRQFKRVGNHLAKLIYAQMADYAIASQAELLTLVALHRLDLHLDGPNDIDWVFPNQLTADRENELYVDLVEDEGGFRWVAPSSDPPLWVTPCGSSLLVDAIMSTGLVSTSGLEALATAWDGFNAAVDSHFTEWAPRTEAAIADVGSTTTAAAQWTVEHWPMPMVEIAVEPIRVKVADLEAERERLDQATAG